MQVFYLLLPKRMNVHPGYLSFLAGSYSCREFVVLIINLDDMASLSQLCLRTL